MSSLQSASLYVHTVTILSLDYYCNMPLRSLMASSMKVATSSSNKKSSVTKKDVPQKLVLLGLSLAVIILIQLVHYIRRSLVPSSAFFSWILATDAFVLLFSTHPTFKFFCVHLSLQWYNYCNLCWNKIKIVLGVQAPVYANYNQEAKVIYVIVLGTTYLQYFFTAMSSLFLHVSNWLSRTGSTASKSNFTAVRFWRKWKIQNPAEICQPQPLPRRQSYCKVYFILSHDICCLPITMRSLVDMFYFLHTTSGLMQNFISCLVGAFWGIPRGAKNIATKASSVLSKSRASSVSSKASSVPSKASSGVSSAVSSSSPGTY